MSGFLKSMDQRFPDRSLREILTRTYPTLHAVAPQDPAARALQVMAEHDIGLVVVLEGHRLAGVLSERDLVRHAGRSATALADLAVAELMTRDVATVTRPPGCVA